MWTCTLRGGLREHGSPLTSRDIAFTYRFVIDNEAQHRSYFPFNPTFATPDDRTLVWTSRKPTFAPDMPPWVYIVPGEGVVQVRRFGACSDQGRRQHPVDRERCRSR